MVELADVVINGVVGFAGLPVTVATLRAGKRLGLANKESLIAAGPVVQPLRATPGAELIPVDSEHCAVHQCLRSGQRRRGGADRHHRQWRAVPRPHRGRARRRDGRRGADPPDVVDGSQDHGRLEHAHEQGAGGDRGARVVRHRLRPDRGRGPPPIGGALDGRVQRRLDDRPAQHARHALADRIRARRIRTASARRSAASTGRRCDGSTSSRPTPRPSAALRSPTPPGVQAARHRPG